MSDYILVLVLLFGNGEAYIDVSKPMSFEKCSVMEASMYVDGADEVLSEIAGGKFNLKWAVCREMK